MRMDEEVKRIFNQYDKRLDRFESDMMEVKTNFATSTQVMFDIKEDLKSLSVSVTKHMEKEEGRLFKTMTFLIITMGSGLIGSITYIFTRAI